MDEITGNSVVNQKSIEDLDHFSLLMIFDMLDPRSLIRCTEVCKNWNKIIGSFPPYMKKLKIKVIGPILTDAAFNTKRKYHHMEIVGIGRVCSSSLNFLSVNFTETFETLQTLVIKNVYTKSDSFINCISELKNLKNLTLLSVLCTKSRVAYEDGMLNAPQLESLRIVNCSSSVLNALITLRAQSKMITINHGVNWQISLYQSLISQQNSLRELKICNTVKEDVALLLNQLAETDGIDFRGNLFLEILDPPILRVIANKMKIETLGYVRVMDVKTSTIHDIETNRHLKVLFTQNPIGLNQLSMIFPSIKFLKTSFLHRSQMKVLESFESLEDLWLDQVSDFFPPELRIPSLNFVTMKRSHYFAMEDYLVENSHVDWSYSD